MRSGVLVGVFVGLTSWRKPEDRPAVRGPFVIRWSVPSRYPLACGLLGVPALLGPLGAPAGG